MPHYDSDTDETYYFDRHDYLSSMIVDMHTQYLPFSYWDQKDTQLVNRCYEEEYNVKISSAGMRKYLDQTFNALRGQIEYELEDKYGFYFWSADNYKGRQRSGVWVQYMVDFQLEYRFLGCAVGEFPTLDAAIAKAFSRNSTILPSPFMEADVACTQIAYVTQMVCKEALYALKENADVPCPQLIVPPSEPMHWHGQNTKKYPKKYMAMIERLDRLAEDVVNKCEEYKAGDFLFDLQDLEVVIKQNRCPETLHVLKYLQKERDTMLEDKQFLGALLVDPRINNKENKFLTTEQKEVAVEHLVGHWMNHNYLQEKLERDEEEVRRKSRELMEEFHKKKAGNENQKENLSAETNNNNEKERETEVEAKREELSVEEVAEDLKRLEVKKPKKKGPLRKKLRALENRDAVPRETDVFGYWRKRATEQPEVANLAAMAFAETSPTVAVKWMPRCLEFQCVTDEELEKMTFVTHNSHFDAGIQYNGNWA